MHTCSDLHVCVKRIRDSEYKDYSIKHNICMVKHDYLKPSISYKIPMVQILIQYG